MGSGLPEAPGALRGSRRSLEFSRARALRQAGAGVLPAVDLVANPGVSLSVEHRLVSAQYGSADLRAYLRGIRHMAKLLRQHPDVTTWNWGG